MNYPDGFGSTPWDYGSQSPLYEEEMRHYDIWAEGYVVTGHSSGAILITSSYEVSGLTSFREACALYYIGDSGYNSKTNSYWGCRLFDNEQDAREKFG